MKKILSIAIAITLTACTGSEVKGALGLKKRAPDEFMVLSRPALTVPPTFDLPEPEQTTITPPQSVASGKAKKVLFGASNAATVGKTKAESLLLNKAGFENAQSDIRQQLDEDVRALEEPIAAEEEKGFFSRLIEPIKLDEASDPIVNPMAEKERIQNAKASGETVDGEDAETIQPKGETTWDRIMNLSH